MGWNTTALYLQGASADEAVAALTPADPTGEWVGADEATSAFRPDVVFAGTAGGWAQVWNPGGDLVPLWKPAGAATALTVMFSSVASTYGFTLHEGTSTRRQYVFSEGAVVVDEGAPLPVESAVPIPSWGPDEDFIFSVVTAVTGTAYDETVQYQAYAPR